MRQILSSRGHLIQVTTRRTLAIDGPTGQRSCPPSERASLSGGVEPLRELRRSREHHRGARPLDWLRAARALTGIDLAVPSKPASLDNPRKSTNNLFLQTSPGVLKRLGP